MMEVFKKNNQDSVDNQQSKLSSDNSNAGLIAANGKTKLYEFTKKIPENVEFENQYMVLIMLLIIGIAFVWGFVKQNKNLK